MILHSGLFLSMEWAILCKSKVFPAFGGETIKDLWPFPVGAVRSITLEERSSVLPVPSSKSILSSGNKGVRFSKEGLFFVLSGSSKFISSIFKIAKYLSPSLGERIFPFMVSPVLNPNLLI